MPPNEIAPPLTEWIRQAVATSRADHIPLLFLSGAQGSGKSTALREAIESLPFPVLGASIDDFYLTKTERAALARKVSPLFQTRGPPGTHDLALLNQTIAALRAAGPDTSTAIPVFDKLADDRAAKNDWRIFKGQPAAIVIEGWLMGAQNAPPYEDAAPLNSVEREDISGLWRAHQEKHLSTDYTDLWNKADSFFHIVAPDFTCVERWRLQQEETLWQAKAQAMPEERRAWVANFIGHYERITRRMLAGSRRDGHVLYIDEERRIITLEK